MRVNQCPNCGASITVTEDIKLLRCEYCNSSFENKYFKEKNIDNNNSQGTYNYNTNSEARIQKGPKTKRPKLNILFVCILFCINPVVSIIYYVLTKAKQKEWDDKYTY